MESAKCRPDCVTIKESIYVIDDIIMVQGKATHMIDSLGSRLRQLRTVKKLRQEQVADLINVNKRAVSAYENDVRQPSYDILIRLATLYRVSTDYLLGCTANRTLDVTGLTTKELSIISELVTGMQEKNKRLEEL